MSKENVLITGISGWIAQFCAVELLKNGYNVRGSLRNISRQQEIINAISKEIDPKDNLTFCKLDLLDDEGWNDAMKDCSYVMHIASPFVIASQKNEDDLIKPAVDGTLRALKAADKAGIKRFVITSSLVSIFSHLKTGKCTPETWTDLSDSELTAYQKSKTLAEKAAWDYIKNSNSKMELTSVNPGAVLGPTLSDDIYGESLNICAELLTGKMPGIPNLSIPMVDVRDVATHHFKAMTVKEAKNKRYISALSTPTPFMEFAKTLSKNGFKVPTKKVPTLLLKFLSIFDRKARGMVPILDRYVECDNSATIKDFNWQPIPLEQTFIDMANSVQAVLNKKN